jgi:hypothetical protein
MNAGGGVGGDGRAPRVVSFYTAEPAESLKLLVFAIFELF